MFDLYEKKAKDIMTPRTIMTYINGKSTVGENEKLIEISEHSRIIVVGDTIDQLIGVIFKNDLLISLKDDDHNLVLSEHSDILSALKYRASSVFM